MRLPFLYVRNNKKKNDIAIHDIITDHIHVSFVQYMPILEANPIIKEMKSKKSNYLENMSTRSYKSLNLMGCLSFTSSSAIFILFLKHETKVES